MTASKQLATPHFVSVDRIVVGILTVPLTAAFSFSEFRWLGNGFTSWLRSALGNGSREAGGVHRFFFAWHLSLRTQVHHVC
jgi:hypothetical protein